MLEADPETPLTCTLYTQGQVASPQSPSINKFVHVSAGMPECCIIQCPGLTPTPPGLTYHHVLVCQQLSHFLWVPTCDYRYVQPKALCPAQYIQDLLSSLPPCKVGLNSVLVHTLLSALSSAQNSAHGGCGRPEQHFFLPSALLGLQVSSMVSCCSLSYRPSIPPGWVEKLPPPWVHLVPQLSACR